MSFSPKQLRAYNDSTARLNLLVGAVRSGKSHVALWRFCKELRQGPSGNYVICGKSENTIIKNIIDPLYELTGGAIRYKRGLGLFELFDKKVYTVGANDERAEGKIRGATFAGALVDEATILPESFFRMLLSRLSVPGARLFATTNPDSPYHWLKTDYIDRSDDLDMKVFNFTLEDNPSLTPQFIDSLKKEYQGLWYKRFIDGLWVLAEGAIYDFFDQKIHVVKRPPTYAKYYLLGIDYGTTNPFCALLLGFNDDVRPAIWIEKEYYYDPKVVGHQQTDSEFAQAIEREFAGYPVRMVYLDPSAESFQVELRRKNKPVKQANNSVIDGIRSVAKYMAQGDLVICNSCTNLIREIEGYVWDSKSLKDGEDRPKKDRDHGVDALRYLIYSHYGQKQTLNESSREKQYQAEQERLWRQNPMQYPGFTNSHGWQNYPMSGGSAFG